MLGLNPFEGCVYWQSLRARIVADGLGHTNEVRLEPGGERLYVVETFGRRISRFRIGADGTLSGKETSTTFGHGTFPDGLAFDSQGYLWVTSIISNRVIRIAPDGAMQVVLEDSDPDHLEMVERAFLTGRMDRSHMDNLPGTLLRSVSSLAS